MATAILNAARLRELLNYNSITGNFYWKSARGGTAKAGSLAGSTDSKGYRQIKIDGRLHLAHRLAWLYVHGAFPVLHLDHIDRNPQNNSIGNLRNCTHAENHQNEGVRSDNTSGITGVSFDFASSKWSAYVGKNSKTTRLGLFDSFDDAVAARIAAKAALHTFHPIQAMHAFGAEHGVRFADGQVDPETGEIL